MSDAFIDFIVGASNVFYICENCYLPKVNDGSRYLNFVICIDLRFNPKLIAKRYIWHKSTGVKRVDVMTPGFDAGSCDGLIKQVPGKSPKIASIQVGNNRPMAIETLFVRSRNGLVNGLTT